MTILDRFIRSPFRIRIPYIVDVVFIAEPDHIREIEFSGDVERLHFYPTQSLPSWIRLYFGVTRFHTPQDDHWFLPFESATNKEYEPRRDYIKGKLGEGYAPEDVKHIADLLLSDATDDKLAAEMTQIVVERFFNEPIPPAVPYDARRTLQKMRDALKPGYYSRAQKAHNRLYQYCIQNVKAGTNAIDAGHHNIGTVSTSAVTALKTLRDSLEREPEEILASNPLTPHVPRIAIKHSTFGGLLNSTTSPGWTVCLYRIAKVARETGDISFTFGAGVPERRCLFYEFFISFMADVKQELDARKDAAQP